MPQTILREPPCMAGGLCIRGAMNGEPLLCETVTSLILLLDEQGRIISCDPRVALIGYSAQQLVGCRLLSMLDISSAAHVARRLKAQKPEYLDTLACTIESGEGHSLEGCLSLMPFHDPTKRVCMVAVLGDACIPFRAAQALQGADLDHDMDQGADAHMSIAAKRGTPHEKIKDRIHSPAAVSVT
jgi:hypothetical protein